MAKTVIATTVLLMLVSSIRADVCLHGDGDGDADVDFGDFAALQRCFTGDGGSATAECEPFDFDGDEDVGLDDYFAFSSAGTGPMASFDYGPSPRDNVEAEQLALEHFSALLAQDAEYERILRDVAAIRTRQLHVANVIHDMSWLPTEMIVKVTDGLSRCGFDALNVFYRMSELEFLFQSGGGTWYVVHFPGRLKTPLLSLDYAALPEVQFADPNGLIGTDDHIQIQTGEDAWTYDLDDGFHDCFDGCDCHIFWTFTVDSAGNVDEVSRNCTGLPWCEFPDFCFAE